MIKLIQPLPAQTAVEPRCGTLTCPKRAQWCWRPNVISLTGAGGFLTLLQILRGTRQQLSVTMLRRDAFYAPFGTYVVQEEVNMHIYA